MKNKIACGLLISILFSITVSAQNFLTQVKTAGNDYWGYANGKGELVIPAKFIYCFKFSSDGLAPIYDEKKMQHYFIDTKGQILMTEVRDFELLGGLIVGITGYSNGWVPVRIQRKWGYMDTSGKIGIPAKYEEATGFKDGYASASVNGKCFVLDMYGTEIPLAEEVREVKEFSEKLAPFIGMNKKYGFIGTDGKVVIPAQFKSVGYFNGGVAWAKNDKNRVGYINEKGEWIVQPQFLAGKEYDPESGLARIREGVLWAYVGKTGDILRVTDTQLYGDFCNGLAMGKKDDKAGFFDNKGVWVIAPQFEAVRDFKNGFAAAKLNGKWGFIDTKGNWLIQPKFDSVKDLELLK